MSKQDIIIKIAKITRLTGEIKKNIDVDGTVDLSLYIPELLYIDTWMEEIYSYFLTDSSNGLTKLILNMGFNNLIEKYIRNHRNEICPAFLEILDKFFLISRELFILCEENSIERKGKYSDLIEPLANNQVAELLGRAVNAGILDEHYQPRHGVRVIHLRIIAYAISNICKFKYPYSLFEEQWEQKGSMRISSCMIPKYKIKDYEKTMALYPEVDFSNLEQKHKFAVFYTMQNVEEVNKLYQELKKYRYIAQDTSLNTFKGIVGKAVFSGSVEWLKDQCQLGYFIYLAFKKIMDKTYGLKGNTVSASRVNLYIEIVWCLDIMK